LPTSGPPATRTLPSVSYVVLDTDVSSKIMRGRLEGGLAGRLTGLTWCVTFVTIGELWQWAEIRSWGPDTRDRLARWLSQVIVLDSDEGVSQTWGRLSASARRRGRARPVNDSWIAACCLSRNLPLATLNGKDFTDFVEHEGLMLLTD
jgi:predicted nucleic acid-binding protein